MSSIRHHTLRIAIIAIAACTSALAPMGTARAQLLSSVTATKNPGNSSNEFSGSGGNPSFQRTSAVSGGQCSNCTTFQTRYSALVSADSITAGNDHTETLDSDYSVNFNVVAPGDYRLIVDTDLSGDLNVVDDGGVAASADITAVSGAQTGGTLASGSLSLSDAGATPVCADSCNDLLSGSSTAEIVGTSNGVARMHTLQFAWSQSATSTGSASTGGNEAAVRLGATSTDTGESAGNYAGTPPRTQADDGHFVRVRVLPGNDSCSNAFPISTNSFFQSLRTDEATSGSEDPSLNCGSAVNRKGGHSVWYSFVAPVNGTLIAETSGSNYDTVLAYSAGAAPASGGCASFASLACSHNTTSGSDSLVQVQAVAGMTYIFEVTSFGTTAGGTLQFATSFATPPSTPMPTITRTPTRTPTRTITRTPTRTNTVAGCPLPTALGTQVPNQIQGTTVGASDAISSCGTSGGGDRFYVFTAPFTSSFLFTLDADFDASLTVVNGLNCDGPVLTCNNGAGNQATATAGLFQGQSVLLEVDGNGSGSYTLRVAVAPNTPTFTPTSTPTEGPPTASPTETPTPSPVCTPPVCDEGTLECPDNCPGGCGIVCVAFTATPTESATETPTSTETLTPTETETASETPVDTLTPTPTETPVDTETATPSESPAPTETLTSTATPEEPTATHTAEPTDTETAEPTSTESPTPIPSDTPSPTETATSTASPSDTATDVPTATDTPTLTPTAVAICTPPPCSDGVLQCSIGVCPGGCDVVCIVFTSTPTPPATETATTTPTEPMVTPIVACVGDCSEDGAVTVDELLTMVNIALGNASVSVCPPADASQDNQVTVEEILVAVNRALTGCPM